MNSFTHTLRNARTMKLTFDCVSPSELTDFFKLYDTDDDFVAYIGDADCDILLSNNYDGKRYIRTYVIQISLPCDASQKDQVTYSNRELEYICDYIKRRLGWE